MVLFWLLFWLLLLPLLQLLFTLFISVVPINYLLEICCCLWVANVWPLLLLLLLLLFCFCCYFYYCYSCLSTPKYIRPTFFLFSQLTSSQSHHHYNISFWKEFGIVWAGWAAAVLFDEIHLCFLKSINVKDSLIIIKVVVL